MKLNLSIDAVTNEFFAYTHILGIVAPLPDYNFCWKLNKKLSLDFRKTKELEAFSRKKNGRKCFFSIYEYKIPNTPNVHYLYNNEYEGDYLLTEFKNFDFIWLIRSDTEDFADIDINAVIASIKAIPQVQLVIQMEHGRIRQIADLMF